MSNNAVKLDGCSGGMSLWWQRFFRQQPPWQGCCDEHDVLYHHGGNKADRFKADIGLLICISRQGHPYWAFLSFLAVRLFGWRRWKTITRTKGAK